MSAQIPLIAEPLRPEPQLVYEARLILTEAIEAHDPVSIYLALSGGNDSRTVAHVSLPLLANDPRFRGAVLVDTGVAIPEAHDAVREYAASVGVPLTIQRTPQSYDALVLKHGFPGPAQHSMMYRNLKERAIRLVTAQAKEGESRMARVVFVSGVRKYESKQRVKLSDPVTKDGSRVWVNPLFWWTTPERNAYQAAQGIPRNPISEIICGSSGDCLCGALADPDGEKEMHSLEVWFPKTAARLRALERRAAAAGVWSRWGHKPPQKVTEPDDETMDLWEAEDEEARSNLFMPMCVGCDLRHETKEAA